MTREEAENWIYTALMGTRVEAYILLAAHGIVYGKKK